MEELLVIIGAELILLVSIVVMTASQKRADVLDRDIDETDGPVASAGRQRPRSNREREKSGRWALPARERAKKGPENRRPLHREMPSVRVETNDLVKQSPESRARHVEGDHRRNTPDQGYRVRASLPQGVRIYAIGDIHGRADLLSQLLSCIEADCRQRPVQRAITVFVGDYIDRGRHSRDVIDLLLRWRERQEAVFLRGNHETFLARFLSDSKTLGDWRQWGGLETLLSYGLQPTINPGRDEQERLADQLANSLPKEHFDFLESLELSYGCGDFFFVHAGIRPGVPIDEQAEEDLLWIREEFLAYEPPFERMIVHGHTPVETADFRSNRINIDTGAFATGRLTCIVIEGGDIMQLPSAVRSDVFSAP